MIKRLYLLIGFLAVLSFNRVNATLLITNVGLDTTTSNNWRTTTFAKPFASSPNNVYGSLGYYAFAPGNFNNFYSGIFSGLDQAGGVLVNGGIGLTDTGGHAYYSGAYGVFDNPTLPPGPSVADENSGFAFIGTTSPGFYPLLNVTVGPGMPSDFRIGILDNGNNGSNTAFAVYTATTTNSIALGMDSAPQYQWSYAFFDIRGAKPGDVFSIAVSSTTGQSVGSAFGLSAITFDTIPEPSSLLLLSVGAVLVCRCRRK